MAICELLSEHMRSECWAYITIHTLLLWKALSFLLCAGKHRWEPEQNTSKQDTNSCCCGWLHGWMESSICWWFRRNKRRGNSTNYGIHHTVQTRLSHVSPGCFAHNSAFLSIFYRQHSTAELFHVGFCLWTYGWSVSCVISFCWGYYTSAFVTLMDKEADNEYSWVRSWEKTVIMARIAPTGITSDTTRRNSWISSVITGLFRLAQRQENVRKRPTRCWEITTGSFSRLCAKC